VFFIAFFFLYSTLAFVAMFEFFIKKWGLQLSDFLTMDLWPTRRIISPLKNNVVIKSNMFLSSGIYAAQIIPNSETMLLVVM
jgi:hypothetical protein